MHQVCEPFIRRRAMRHLEKRACGDFWRWHREPYFSTDTAAALRAMEMKADVILKATRVEGIYSADPEKVADAKFFSQVTYRDVFAPGSESEWIRRPFRCAWIMACRSWCSA